MKNDLLGPKYAKKKQKNNKSVESSLLGGQVNLILSRLNHPHNTCQTHSLVTGCGLGLDFRNEMSTKMSHLQLLSLVSCLTDCPQEKEKIRLTETSRTPPGIGEILPISKTPLCVLQHCLDTVECSISAEPDLSVLEKASDDAFVIIGNMNPFSNGFVPFLCQSILLPFFLVCCHSKQTPNGISSSLRQPPPPRNVGISHNRQPPFESSITADKSPWVGFLRI